MTTDRSRDSYYARLPDDWLEGAGIVGLFLVVYASAYSRGRWVESGLTAEQWARVTAQAGPYWPMVLFGVGMALMAAALVTMLIHRG